MSKTTMHMSVGARLAVVMLTVSVLATGCLLEPRQPIPPGEGGQDSDWVPPDQPAVVFQNLKTGLENLNGVNYNRSLSDDFGFSPTLQDSLDPSLPGAYDGWDLSVEEGVTNLMVSEADTIEVDFNQSVNINEADFVQFRVEYTLRVVSQATGSTTYKGVAHFDVRRETAGWHLLYWDEVENVDGFSTWGFLKGTLRLQLQP